MKNKTLSASILAWLRGFNTAAKTLSFTGAAKELNVTQGSISQQVKNLEDYLGQALFERKNKTLTLTTAGKELFITTEESFTELSKTIKKLKKENSIYNEFVLSCSPSFAMGWLTPRLRSLSAISPNLSIRIRGEFHLLGYQTLDLSKVDAGIRYDPGMHQNLQTHCFLDEWLIPVATPTFISQHPEISESKTIPCKLMLHDMSAWEQAPETAEWDHWLKYTNNPMTTSHTGLHFNLSMLALNAALSNHGVAIGRLSLVLDDLLQKKLIAPIPIAVKSPAAYYYIQLNDCNPTDSILRDWLIQEGLKFKQKRDKFLKSLITIEN